MNRPSSLLSQTQPPPQSKRSPWGTVRWIAVMLLAAGGIAGAGWWGVQLMVNPQTLLWMNRWFPDWIPISVTGLKPPQTMTQIRRELEQAGLMAGEPLPLDKNTSFLDQKSSVDEMLLPILKSSTPCQGTCDRIVELRLYQSTLARRKDAQREPYFQQVSALPIVGPDDAFVVAPIVDARSGNQGSTRALPLTMLSRFEGTVPSEGVWLNLSGRTVRGDTTIAYGRVLHYNPRRFHLSTPLDWTSPVGKDPVWQELTGQGQPELLIDQTVGMEPQFKVYRVTTINFAPNPTQLEPIALLESALNLPAYDTALLLARSGLWSPSEQWLQSLKRRGKWSAQAQAQLDVIRLHAVATQAQAEKSWSSPGQQVLANLMDGRWARALTVFAASAETGQETAAMLKGASDRVENRIETALAVNPSTDVKAWMALLIASRQNTAKAIAWLKQQPKTTAAERSQIASLLARLDTPIADADPTINAPAGRVIGSGRLLPTLNPAEWLTPKQAPPLKLEEQQAWYTVQVTGFHDGKRWRFGDLPAATSADAVWQQLGFTADPPLQIVFWTPDGQEQTVYASIKAVRRSSSGLQLLAIGDAIVPSRSQLRPLAFTDSALQWLTPSTMTLSELAQQQPAWATRAIPALAAELRRSGNLPAKKSAWDALNQVGAGDWSVQQVSLTGSQPDAVLTVYPASRSPRTLIFSPTGALLYSELSTEADYRVLAIADLGDGVPAVIADSPNSYRSLRWSTTRKRFE